MNDCLHRRIPMSWPNTVCCAKHWCGCYGRDLISKWSEKAPQSFSMNSMRKLQTSGEEDLRVFIAVRLGVSGYVSKEASAAEIIAAVRAVARREAVFPPKLCMALFQRASRESRKRPAITDREARIKFGLTYPQSQLVALVARGLSNKEFHGHFQNLCSIISTSSGESGGLAPNRERAELEDSLCRHCLA